jgi:hypothetical protein
MPFWLAAILAPIAMVVLAYAIAALIGIARWLHHSLGAGDE